MPLSFARRRSTMPPVSAARSERNLRQVKSPNPIVRNVERDLVSVIHDRTVVRPRSALRRPAFVTIRDVAPDALRTISFKGPCRGCSCCRKTLFDFRNRPGHYPHPRQLYRPPALRAHGRPFIANGGYRVNRAAPSDSIGPWRSGVQRCGRRWRATPASAVEPAAGSLACPLASTREIVADLQNGVGNPADLALGHVGSGWQADTAVEQIL